MVMEWVVAKYYSSPATGPDRRMSHRKWRVTKQDPSRARPGTQLGCCLFSLHFLCDILQSSPVHIGCEDSWITVLVLIRRAENGAGSLSKFKIAIIGLFPT